MVDIWLKTSYKLRITSYFFQHMQNKIKIKGAREHNLKNINLELPRNKMIVFTGLSGSGKSSLAFDTIFAEGQRRYVESLSAYARQFLRQMQKPDVDEISGLSPAISIMVTWWITRSIAATVIMVSGKIWSHWLKGWLDVMIKLPLS